MKPRRENRQAPAGGQAPSPAVPAGPSSDETGRAPVRRAGSARDVALETLRAVEAREAFLQAALESAVQKAGLDPRDRGLALELTSGVLRWQRRLDHRLAPFLRRGLDATPPVLLNVLRLAVYQLGFMDRVPPRAAVHEAVVQARMVGGEGGARLVNAVLRAVAASTEALPEGDTPEALGVRLSHPDWLAAQALDLLGPEEGAALLAAHNRPAPLTVRAPGAPEVTATRLTEEGATLTPCAFAPGAWHLEHRAPFATAAFAGGLFRVQDEAAQLVVHLLAPRPGDRVWDACAAPGGKSQHLVDLTGGRLVLLSTDAHAGKVRRLAETLGRGPGLETAVHDAREPLDRTFDRVLLDAPCSGLGTLRRHPEIRWRRTPESIAELAAAQAVMIRACADTVRPGGTLVYSVCTLTDAEGPEVVAGFLKDRPDFALDLPVPGEGGIDWGPLLVPLGLRTWPHRHDMDGFFATRLRRRP